MMRAERVFRRRVRQIFRRVRAALVVSSFADGWIPHITRRVGGRSVSIMGKCIPHDADDPTIEEEADRMADLICSLECLPREPR